MCWLHAEHKHAFFKFNGSMGVSREQRQMVAEDHKAGYEYESIERAAICNTEGCYCRGGVKAFGCPSMYRGDSGYGFYFRARKLQSEVYILANRLANNPHAQSTGCYFPPDLLKPVCELPVSLFFFKMHKFYIHFLRNRC